ncbi:MAG: hypothetical protein CL878_00485 [Dehalococcoidia bacterium]|nr:hypothetical protein [Dehalococcoidia bacterium]
MADTLRARSPDKPGAHPKSTKRVVISCSLGPYGGAETHVYWLALLLAEAGTHVTLAARSFAWPPSWQRRLRAAGIRLVTTPLPWWRYAPHLRNLWALLVWPHLLVPRSYDVLFAAGSGSFHLWLRRFVRPGGWRIYNEVLGVPPRRRGRVLWRYVRLLQGVDGVLVYAPSVATALRANVSFAAPLRVIPPLHGGPMVGHPDEEVAGNSRVWTDSGTRPLRLVYVGRMIPGKQPGLLLDLWPYLRATLAPARLDFYGDGPEVAPLHRLAVVRGWQGEVTLHGRYDQETDLQGIFDSVDLLVLPATGGEGLPLVVLEAMARGVPAVVTSVGGLQDLADLAPEVSVVAPRPAALATAIVQSARQLRRGDLDHWRLRAHYRQRFRYDVIAPLWRNALLEPDLFWRASDAQR